MQFGQCQLSVVPVRIDHADEAEMVTQVLFGEVFLVTESHNQWRKIKLAFDEYEGWIDEKQMIEIEEEEFNYMVENRTPHSFATADEIEVPKNITIVRGSSLPHFKNQQFKLGGETYELDSTPYFKETVNTDDICKVAMSYIETPYLWGGRSPFGIDCSGFTQIVFKILGVKLKRDASQQVNQGKKIDYMYCQSGDVAFFINKKGRIHHVGILLDESTIIHAAGKVRIDKLDEEGIYNEEKGSYTHQLHSLKRML